MSRCYERMTPKKLQALKGHESARNSNEFRMTPEFKQTGKRYDSSYALFKRLKARVTLARTTIEKRPLDGEKK